MTTTSTLSPTRRQLLSGAVSAGALGLFLSACSNSGDPKAAVASSSAASRTVTTVKGNVVVPANPARVVAGTAWSVNTLLDLGVVPVGSFNGAANVVLPEFRDRMKDVANTSAADGYSDAVEKIAALKPDLIFAFASSETLPQQQQIAPVIAQDSQHATWEDLCGQVAQALGKESEMAGLKKKFEERKAQLKSTYAKVFASNTWYLVQPGGDAANPAVLYAPKNTEVGLIIKELGGKFGPAEEGTTYGDNNSVGQNLANELLPRLGDGSVIFVWDNGDQPSPAAQTLYSQSLWKALPAVKAGNVMRGSLPGSYGQALAFLDQLEEQCKRLSA